jgi:hypothetical protein
MTDDQEPTTTPDPEPTIAEPVASTGPPDIVPDPEADFWATDPGSFATMQKGAKEPDPTSEVREQGEQSSGE